MTPFAASLHACGLTQSDAAAILRQSPSSIEKKSRGARNMTPGDARILSGIWHRVRQGDAEGLPAGAVAMSGALRALRGVETIPKRRPGRRLMGLDMDAGARA